MAATDTWSCTAEVLPGRQAKSSVDVDQRATPAHYEARRRSPRHLPEDGAQARPPSPPRPRARHGQPRPRVAMISACTGRVFDRRRNPGSMAVAGPGAPIVNSKAILCAGLLSRGRTQDHSRVPVRFLSIWTAFSGAFRFEIQNPNCRSTCLYVTSRPRARGEGTR